MRNLISYFLILFCSVISCKTDSLDGIWITTQRVDVYNEPSSIDTSYASTFALIEFQGEKNIFLQGVGGQKIQGIYRRVSDSELSVKVDSMDYIIVEQGEQLIFSSIKSSYQNSYFVFERMSPPSTLSSKKLENIDFTTDTYWKVEADTNSMNYGFEYLFLDSGEMIMNQVVDDYGSISWGTYQRANHSNNLFLYVVGGPSLEERMYRVYAQSYNKLNAQLFENIYDDIPFKKQKIVFTKKTLPKEEKLSKTKEVLYGDWINGNKAFFTSSPISILSEYDNQSYELRLLRDGNFSINYSGTLLEDNKEYERSINGTWELGRTGKFIILTTSKGFIKLVSILELTQNVLSISLEIEDIKEDDFYISNHTVNLKKNN